MAIPPPARVRQGLVLVLLLLTRYVAPIGRLMDSFGICYNIYADDTQLYAALTVQLSASLNLLQVCTVELQPELVSVKRPAT